MKKALLSVCLVILVFLQATTCGKKDASCPPDDHNGLTIYNQSARTINYEIYWNYPDTAIGEYNPITDGTDGLSSGEESKRGAGPTSCWESVLKNGKKEWIYFFDQDSLKAIPWNVVRTTGRGLLERREIDLSQLKANDFKVVFQ